MHTHRTFDRLVPEVITPGSGHTFGHHQPRHTHASREQIAGAFLFAYSNPNTRESYRFDLTQWFRYCDTNRIPYMDAVRSHIDTWMREGEARGLAPATLSRRLTAVRTFYEWLVDEEFLDRNPCRKVRRPVVPKESSRHWLTRHELADVVAAAEKEGGYPYALICLLTFNALRISEVIHADIDDMGRERHNTTLRIMGKGSKPAVVTLPARTVWALDQAHAGREEGPLILGHHGHRLSRESAARTCRRITHRAGITRKNITPHSFRHSSISAGFDEGIDSRAMQRFARHASSATTQRYDRKQDHLDQSVSYRVEGYVAAGIDR